MLHYYDNAVAADLAKALDPSSEVNKIVKVMEPDGIIPLIAQMKEDQIDFPLVCLFRNSEVPISTDQINFTRVNKGVPTGYDPDTNNIYLEKAIPVELGYKLVILSTNTADADEFAKEILFRYSSVFFITMDLPYEVDRQVRFGITIEPGSSITKDSGVLEYIQGGTLYQTTISLKCQGAVLLSYTPKHVQRLVYTAVETK